MPLAWRRAVSASSSRAAFLNSGAAARRTAKQPIGVAAASRFALLRAPAAHGCPPLPGRRRAARLSEKTLHPACARHQQTLQPGTRAGGGRKPQRGRRHGGIRHSHSSTRLESKRRFQATLLDSKRSPRAERLPKPTRRPDIRVGAKPSGRAWNRSAHCRLEFRLDSKLPRASSEACVKALLVEPQRAFRRAEGGLSFGAKRPSRTE